MSLVLFGSFLVLIVIGVPIAFSMALSTLAAIIYDGRFPLSLVAQQTIAGADSYALLAIPLFILAGNLMNSGGITERIIAFANAIVGRFRGGMGQTTVLSAMLFSGVSGSAIADATALGKVLIPAMIDRGYGRPFAAATMAASAVNGPIIPPSIPLVIYAITLGSSSVTIERLFLGGVIPGTLLGIALMLVVYAVARRRGFAASAPVSLREIPARFVRALPALLMPVLVLGTVSTGIVTVTESAALAVVYALAVTVLVYRRMSARELVQVLKASALESAVILIIVAAAAAFAWLLAITALPEDAARWIAGISTNPIVVLLLMNILLLIVGSFMDGLAAMIILIPVLAPVAMAVGIDPTHLGLVIVFNLMLGLLTPPVGLLLFICGNFAGCKLGEQVREVLPMFGAGVAVLMLISYFPQLVLWLPNLISPR